MTAEELMEILADIESDRVEKTISTSNTDKFGQAICAFANDLPNHNKPGYLIVGIDEKTGRMLSSEEISDQLLQNLAAIRTDGQLQPQPSMSVEKIDMPQGSVAIVTVQPHTFPPVRYNGNIWVRVGPRKGKANEADEKILLEKRASRMQTFDALPCFEATIEDLDVDLFRMRYLPLAFPEDVLKKDSRKVEHQLQALGFFNVKYNCPTFAGVIMFGRNPERFLPGCYVQYVKFSGKGRAGKILSEYKFSGNLMNILYELDTFVKTTITNRRPVPVSALREEMVYDYPHWATRELLMNSVCHRDYEGNGPVQFYQYDDRLEILNPGGLYGKATPENFPYVNDYRNGVIAEAMKVLGFVNRYSRGVQTVQEELKENGNGEAEFKLHLVTAFLVIEHISGKLADDNSKVRDSANFKVNFKTNFKERFGDISDKLIDLLILLYLNPKLKYSELKDRLSIGRTALYKYLSRLQESGIIKREGARKNGSWVIVEPYDEFVEKFLGEQDATE